MSKRLIPDNDHVLVKDLPRTTTLDDITLPDNERQQEMAFGFVVEVGPQVDQTYTKPGDHICYGPYAGKTIPIDGIEFRILKAGQIEGHLVDRE